MPALAELQTRFRRALFDEHDRGLPAMIHADGVAPRARIELYRHHVRASLTGALRATYPVVCRLVGDAFFERVAWDYIRDEPPRSPLLFEYGRGFAGFLDHEPACGALPYLPDVAQLEWTINCVVHEEDEPAVGRDALAGIAPAAAPRIRLEFRSNIAYVASRWPVEAIWRGNQPGIEPPEIDLDSGGSLLELRCTADRLMLRPLSSAAFAFRTALAEGQQLGAAAEAAFAEDEAFDLAAALEAVIAEGLVAAVRVAGSDSKPA